MINLVIITHGEFGAYLVEAAEWIVGQQPQGVEVISISPKTTLDKVKETLNETVARNDSPDGLIFMTDMLGGTPTNMVLPLAKDIPNSAVICGININMLVSAFSYRSTMSLENLVKKILEDGRKSICDVKSLLVMREHTSGESGAPAQTPRTSAGGFKPPLSSEGGSASGGGWL